jgi:hypothetical protein
MGFQEWNQVGIADDFGEGGGKVGVGVEGGVLVGCGAAVGEAVAEAGGQARGMCPYPPSFAQRNRDEQQISHKYPQGETGQGQQP